MLHLAEHPCARRRTVGCVSTSQPDGAERLPPDLGLSGSPPPVPPPAMSRVAVPAYNELPSEWFERLCVDIASAVEGTDFDLFGRPGQRQDGIDMYGKREDGKYIAWQAKRQVRLAPRDLSTAFERFLSGALPFRVSRFVVVGPFDERDRRLRSTLEATAAAHPDLELELWGAERLTRALRGHRDIVLRYLGDAWADLLCPDAAAQRALRAQPGQPGPVGRQVPNAIDDEGEFLHRVHAGLADRGLEVGAIEGGAVTFVDPASPHIGGWVQLHPQRGVEVSVGFVSLEFDMSCWVDLDQHLRNAEEEWLPLHLRLAEVSPSRCWVIFGALLTGAPTGEDAVRLAATVARRAPDVEVVLGNLLGRFRRADIQFGMELCGLSGCDRPAHIRIGDQMFSGPAALNVCHEHGAVMTAACIEGVHRFCPGRSEGARASCPCACHG